MLFGLMLMNSIMEGRSAIIVHFYFDKYNKISIYDIHFMIINKNYY